MYPLSKQLWLFVSLSEFERNFLNQQANQTSLARSFFPSFGRWFRNGLLPLLLLSPSSLLREEVCPDSSSFRPKSRGRRHLRPRRRKEDSAVFLISDDLAQLPFFFSSLVFFLRGSAGGKFEKTVVSQVFSLVSFLPSLPLSVLSLFLLPSSSSAPGGLFGECLFVFSFFRSLSSCL